MPLNEFAKGAIAGAFGGVITDKVEKKIDSLLPHTKSGWEEFLETLPQKFEQLCTDLHALAQAETLVPEITTANLFAYPAELPLNYKGRKHLSVFALTSFQVRLFSAAVGMYTPTLAAGWNALDLPEGSTIALPLGTSGSQLVMIMASDTSLGNAI